MLRRIGLGLLVLFIVAEVLVASSMMFGVPIADIYEQESFVLITICLQCVGTMLSVMILRPRPRRDYSIRLPQKGDGVYQREQ